MTEDSTVQRDKLLLQITNSPQHLMELVCWLNYSTQTVTLDHQSVGHTKQNHIVY